MNFSGSATINSSKQAFVPKATADPIALKSMTESITTATSV